MHRKAKHKKEKKFFETTLLIIFVMLVIYSSYNIILWLVQNKKQRQIQEELISKIQIQNVVCEKDKIEDNSNNTEIDFKAIKDINNDVVAWIKIPEIEVNNPVVQGSDNEYYLHRNFYKEENVCGCLFMDYENKVDFTDDNTIIYGHNMKSGLMFGNLSKIYNGEIGNNVNISIYTEKATYTYKVFATYKENAHFDIKSSDITGENANNLISKSKIKFEDFNSLTKNKIISLVTCDSSGTGRVIVLGMLIDTTS